MDSQRRRIEEIDSLILDLLEERAEVGKEIARIKNERGLDITDPAQEMRVIERVQEQTDLEVKNVYVEIIEMTKKEMRDHG